MAQARAIPGLREHFGRAAEAMKSLQVVLLITRDKPAYHTENLCNCVKKPSEGEGEKDSSDHTDHFSSWIQLCLKPVFHHDALTPITDSHFV